MGFFVWFVLFGVVGFVFFYCWLRNEALLHLNILDHQCKFRIAVLLHSTKQSCQPQKSVLTLTIPCVSCGLKHAFL